MPFPETRDALIAAGYKFESHARCKGVNCKQEIEYWTTNNGKRMPFDLNAGRRLEGRHTLQIVPRRGRVPVEEGAVRQSVEYMRIAFETRQKYLPDRYQFRADRKYHWLQKLAIWTLRKLKCESFIMEEQMVRTELINKANLEKQIIEQYHDMLNWYHHIGADRLLVGPMEFSELAVLPFDRPFSLNLNFGWAEPDKEPPYNTKLSRFGLKLTVIPHMKGMLVLPKGWDQ